MDAIPQASQSSLKRRSHHPHSADEEAEAQGGQSQEEGARMGMQLFRHGALGAVPWHGGLATRLLPGAMAARRGGPPGWSE